MVVKVEFDLSKTRVHNMVTWRYAYQQARGRYWEIAALDRSRFERRITDTHKVLANILNCDHRKRIYIERFSEL